MVVRLVLFVCCDFGISFFIIIKIIVFVVKFSVQGRMGCIIIIVVVLMMLVIGFIVFDICLYQNVLCWEKFFCFSGIDIVVFFGKFCSFMFIVSVIVVLMEVDGSLWAIVLKVIFIVSFFGILCSVIVSISSMLCFQLVDIFLA